MCLGPACKKPTPQSKQQPAEPRAESAAASNPTPDATPSGQARPEGAAEAGSAAASAVGGGGARNDPPVALYVAERLEFIDKLVTFRVTAEPGDYFNCYYKGKQKSYHHIRLRGDGSLYLDGYVPRDAAGEALWLRLRKHKRVKITAKVVMRPATVTGVCVGQVEILDQSQGWDFARGGVGDPGALGRRIANGKDKTPARNRPSIRTFHQSRKRFVGKALSFKVRARLDRYHQCRYRDAERTHYALMLTGDGFKGLRGYIRREGPGRKLARMLAVNEGAQITVDVTVPEGRYDELCPDQVEVTGWRAGW